MGDWISHLVSSAADRTIQHEWIDGIYVHLFARIPGTDLDDKRNIKQFAVLTLLPFIGLAYILFTKRVYLMWRLEGLADREGDGGYFMRVIADAVSSAGWFGQGFLRRIRGSRTCIATPYTPI